MKTNEPASSEANRKGFVARLVWIACLVVVTFAVYMLSLGPVVAFYFRNNAPSGKRTPRWVEIAYAPAVAVWRSLPEPLEIAYGNYIEWCMMTFDRDPDLL